MRRFARSRQNRGKKIIAAPPTRMNPMERGETSGRKRIQIADDEAMSDPSRTSPAAKAKGLCFITSEPM